MADTVDCRGCKWSEIRQVVILVALWQQEWERDWTQRLSFAPPAHVLVAMGSTRAECKKTVDKL